MRDALGAIGVFDSGVGGLTVVSALLDLLPTASILYVADQAHVPYGGRPAAEVRRFAGHISAFLHDCGCGAVVMACNISSATALVSVSERWAPMPVFGMIQAGAESAIDESPNTAVPIGVLATEGTVATKAYTRAIQSIRPGTRVIEVSCPLLVPLVESDATDGAEALRAAETYLTPLARQGCQVIVLGCTHYPYLTPTLERAAGVLGMAAVTFVNPARHVARSVVETARGVLDLHRARCVFATTGDCRDFDRQLPRFLPGTHGDVWRLHWVLDCLEWGTQLIRRPEDTPRAVGRAAREHRGA